MSLNTPNAKNYGSKGKRFLEHRHGGRFIVLEHQHGRRFIVLEHQYGRRDVM